uniref:C2HC/C3H-type domain-containing protein n=1 Tax=Ciona savignyi TaxID=51511 RepID=H2YHL0_CIOSA
MKYQVSMDMQHVPQPNEYEQEDVVLAPCSICGRKFKQERLSKHKEVCMKSTNKKRKVFDMSKARKQGTDLENYRTKRKTKEPPKRNNWKLKHEDFIQTVRHAKSLSKYEAMGGNIADLPPPPPSLNPDYIQCQYCERRFAPQAAERHIPKCKDMKARPTPLRRKPTRRI